MLVSDWQKEESAYSKLASPNTSTFKLYTRTRPVAKPLSSFPVDPIATVLPSLDKLTLPPEKSPIASPSISAPIWVQVPPTFS